MWRQFGQAVNCYWVNTTQIGAETLIFDMDTQQTWIRVWSSSGLKNITNTCSCVSQLYHMLDTLGTRHMDSEILWLLARIYKIHQIHKSWLGRQHFVEIDKHFPIHKGKKTQIWKYLTPEKTLNVMFHSIMSEITRLNSKYMFLCAVWPQGVHIFIQQIIWAILL